MTQPRPDMTTAQTGELLSDVYPAERPIPSRRPSGKTAKTTTGLRGARPPAGLNQAERLGVIESLTTMLEGVYAHLPLKRAMYAIDPVQRLNLLARRTDTMEEQVFHYELVRILTGLRDAHTRYVGPASLAGRVAMLPFLVESFGAPPENRYIVSRVAEETSLIGDPNFTPGVELLWWNAVPIDRAVDLYAEFETGGRPDARRARALESLTFRSLQYAPPPNERWVAVGYRDSNGVERETRIPWRVIEPGRAPTARAPKQRQASAIDPAREAARRAKKLLFAFERWSAEQRAGKTAQAGPWFESKYQDAVGARIVDTKSGRFGYLRLWTFDVANDRDYVREVARLLGRIEDEGEGGLVVDLRANPGGLIWAAERLLQLFTPEPVVPTRFSFLATRLTRAMAAAEQNQQELSPWQQSLNDAVETGEPYSLSAPITPLAACNDIGQVYGGPVLAVVDPNTYSAGDLFAAGFYDNRLGPVVTVGEATGGGGANVWWWNQVSDALAGTQLAQAPLPAGIDVSVAVRRATRTGPETNGGAIEDVGVRGHVAYTMTERDLTSGNQDLLDRCGEILSRRPSTRLRLPKPTSRTRNLKVTTQGLDRLDLYVDGVPTQTASVQDGTTTLAAPAGWAEIEVRGFAGGELRQRRRFSA